MIMRKLSRISTRWQQHGCRSPLSRKMDIPPVITPTTAAIIYPQKVLFRRSHAIPYISGTRFYR